MRTKSDTRADTTGNAPERVRRPQGFAVMDPKLVVELAARGGKEAHRTGAAHEFTREEAQIAGRKGALATHAKRRARLAAAAATRDAEPLVADLERTTD